MQILFPFIFFSFCFQFIALEMIKNQILRWIPTVILELLLIFGIIHHWIDPPSFDILGWEIYLWMMSSVFLGSMLAWGGFALCHRKKR
ncbi:MAG: hypothetical protein HFF49_03490 [Lawsonibacter sp.]|jgi:hypothetical protein|nr:hypothetical protein [Lawsonibacter sp.]